MSRWGRLRENGVPALLVALVAGGVLLTVPAPDVQASALLTVAQAWPQSQRGTVPAVLDDGTPYTPIVFLDVKTSVGTSRSADGKTLRLVLRRPDGTVRQLRSVATAVDPSFPATAVVDGVLAFVAGSRDGYELWTVPVDGDTEPRRLTTDLGDVRFYQSQYDLMIADGRVHWVAAGPQNGTELRSVALTGGAVQVQGQPGVWSRSAWPWIVDGVTAAGGATELRDPASGRTRSLPSTRRGVTACTPAWCQLVSITEDGDSRIEMLRPDGSDRSTAGDGTAATVVADPAVLDRFEIFSQQTDTSELTGGAQILAYDLTRRTTVEISPDALQVSYRNGVLWWSTGTQQSQLRHVLDLRTI